MDPLIASLLTFTFCVIVYLYAKSTYPSAKNEQLIINKTIVSLANCGYLDYEMDEDGNMTVHPLEINDDEEINSEEEKS